MTRVASSHHHVSHYIHAETPLCRLDEGPLAGLRHRTVIESRTGACQLALWQEEHRPGFEVPPHRHDCEEIISVLAGEIVVWIDGATWTVRPGESILIPHGSAHGFRVAGGAPVRLLAIFGSSTPSILRLDGSRTIPPWEGGQSNHLDQSSSFQSSNLVKENSCES